MRTEYPPQTKIATIMYVVQAYGVSAEFLAQQADIYPEHLRKVLRGERVLTWKTVDKIRPVLKKYNTDI